MESSFSLLYRSSSRVSVENSALFAAGPAEFQRVIIRARWNALTFDDRIHGTGLLTEATVDALGHVDVWALSS